MTHELGSFAFLASALVATLTGSIAIALYNRRRKTGILALNWLVVLFGTLFLLGLTEFCTYTLHDVIPFFDINDDTTPLYLNIVRIFNLAGILILYFFAESIMSRNYNIYRFTIVISLVTGIIVTGIISSALGYRIETNTVLGTQGVYGFDEFLFDILQFVIVFFVCYMFYKQMRFIESSQHRTYISLLLIAAFLYLVAMAIEVLEYFTDKISIDAFISALPTMALLAYVYLRYPNMIYLVPTEIKFLQLISVRSGIPVYVAEFEDDPNNLDFLIGPGLSSVRTMLKELLSDNQSTFKMQSFQYSNGFLIFEESTGLFALLQANNLSKILLNSLKYFIREFESTFGQQISNFKGKIDPVDGESPDDVLRRCIPIVQAKPIVSSLG